MSRQPSISALQAFAAVMRHGTVTEAARRLHIAQPALSRLVAQCEDALGVQLFKRQRKRLIPTEVAELILPDIERLLASHAELPLLATGLESGSGSIFRIAAAPRLADGLVGCAVRRMQSCGYTFRFSVDGRERAEIDHWVVSSRYDIGLASLPVAFESVRVVPFAEAQAVVVMRRDDPLAQQPSCRMAEVSRRKLITTAPGSLMRERTVSAFASAGLGMNAVAEARTGPLALQFVAQNLGVAVLDQFSSIGLRPDLTVRTLEGGFTQQIGFLLPKAAIQPATIDRFIEIAREIAHAHGIELI